MMVKRKEKMNPRIIIYGVPANLSSDTICEDIIALNLKVKISSCQTSLYLQAEK